MMARRAILKLISVSPLSAVGAKAALAEHMASPALSTAVAAAHTMTAGAPQAIGYAAEHTLGKTLFRQIENLRNEYAEEVSSRYALRDGAHFDPDIAALRSCSFSYKFSKQFERDKSDQSFLSGVARKLYSQ